ncbi:hypothetical protein JCM18882A_32830 [Brevibacterium metallidurans]|uniref:Uncharacterized protein n=1 Tax=Brevibacterium metallidurans TaxID=1482676 RepID=A0ABN0SSX6_9MICO
MNRRLCCKWQYTDLIVPELRLILRNETNVACKDNIAESCEWKEIVKVRWILLVPEHHSETSPPALLQKFDCVRFDARSSGELKLPLPLIAVPCRLEKDEVEVIQLTFPRGTLQCH